MRKKVIFVVLVLLIGVSGFVYASMVEDSNGAYDVELELEEGWNIIAGTIPSEGILEDSEIKLSDIGAMWYYSPLQKKYIMIHPNTDWDAIKQDDEDFVLTTSMWIYSEKAGTIKYSTLEDYPSLENRQLIAGWNFVTITPDIVNPGIVIPEEVIKIEDFTVNCNILKSYVFDSEHQRWENILNEEQFYSGADGLGWVIKVSEDCNLGLDTGGDITPPPELPEGEVGCIDTDGKNPFNEGYVSYEDEGTVRTYDKCVLDSLAQDGSWYAEVGGIRYGVAEGDECNGGNCFVAESYCMDEAPKFEIFDCSNGCVDGACIQ